MFVLQEPKVQHGWQENIAQESADQWEHAQQVPEVAPIVEHEDEPCMNSEEVVTNTQFYDMEGVVHKNTGKILNFVEALREALIDLSKGGEFYDVVSGSYISLDKAVERGFIADDINNILNGHHGLRNPETGHEITLREAIQIGLYDPEIRQLRDIDTGKYLQIRKEVLG